MEKQSFDILKRELTEKLEEFGYIYIEIDSLEELKKIHSLWSKNIIGVPETGVEYLYFGSYHRKKEDYDKAVEHYKRSADLNCETALNCLSVMKEKGEITIDELIDIYKTFIEKGSIFATTQLGRLYMDTGKYKEMKILLLRAIEKGDAVAMNDIGHYYYQIKKKNEKAKSYYLKAIENGNNVATFNYAHYCLNIEHNAKEMKKYCHLGIAKKFGMAADYLALYYRNKGKYQKMKKYYRIAIDLGYLDSYISLGSYYQGIGKFGKSLFYFLQRKKIDDIELTLKWMMSDDNPLDKYFYQSLPLLKSLVQENANKIKIPPMVQGMITLYNKEIDVLENAFKYLPEADGYEKAKEDFNTQLSQMV
jgi:TPR repeat protein